MEWSIMLLFIGMMEWSMRSWGYIMAYEKVDSRNSRSITGRLIPWRTNNSLTRLGNGMIHHVTITCMREWSLRSWWNGLWDHEGVSWHMSREREKVDSRNPWWERSSCQTVLNVEFCSGILIKDKNSDCKFILRVGNRSIHKIIRFIDLVSKELKIMSGEMFHFRLCYFVSRPVSNATCIMSHIWTLQKYFTFGGRGVKFTRIMITNIYLSWISSLKFLKSLLPLPWLTFRVICLLESWSIQQFLLRTTCTCNYYSFLMPLKYLS